MPYFYQYDNDYEPSGTCGVTSAAMLVDTFHPGSVTPDSLYRAYGKAQGGCGPQTDHVAFRRVVFARDGSGVTGYV